MPAGAGVAARPVLAVGAGGVEVGCGHGRHPAAQRVAPVTGRRTAGGRRGSSPARATAGGRDEYSRDRGTGTTAGPSRGTLRGPAGGARSPVRRGALAKIPG